MSAREDPAPVRLVGVERVVLYVNVIHVAVRTAVVPTVHVYVQMDGMESTVLWKVIFNSNCLFEYFDPDRDFY